MVGNDGLYILVSLALLLVGLWAQVRIRHSFNKYSKISSSRGIVGAEAARMLLDSHGLQQVNVEQVGGVLSDHYDSRSKTLRLSPQVYQSNSLAALGVAAHEVGHALQDQQNYAPLMLRSVIAPSVLIGSWLGPLIFLAGLILSATPLAGAGLLLFGATSLFALVTLPIEFNASKRAEEILVSHRVLTHQELVGVHSVLDAAALTYVAAALQAILTLLYYASLLTGQSD